MKLDDDPAYSNSAKNILNGLQFLSTNDDGDVMTTAKVILKGLKRLQLSDLVGEENGPIDNTSSSAEDVKTNSKSTTTDDKEEEEVAAEEGEDAVAQFVGDDRTSAGEMKASSVARQEMIASRHVHRLATTAIHDFGCLTPVQLKSLHDKVAKIYSRGGHRTTKSTRTVQIDDLSSLSHDGTSEENDTT